MVTLSHGERIVEIQAQRGADNVPFIYALTNFGRILVHESPYARDVKKWYEVPVPPVATDAVTKYAARFAGKDV